MNKYELIFNSLIDVWRIVSCIFLCLLFGMVIGVALELHHDKFLNASIGVEAAVPFGYFIGLWWHISATRKTKEKMALPMVIILGAISLVLGYRAVLNEIPDTIEYMNAIEELKSLQTIKISKIEIQLKGTNIKRGFKDPAVLSEFVVACKDLQGYSPNRQQYISTYIITLHGGNNIEFECRFPPGKSERIIGYIMPKNGDNSIGGSFTSYNLKSWLEKYILSTNR